MSGLEPRAIEQILAAAVIIYDATRFCIEETVRSFLGAYRPNDRPCV